MIAVHQRLLERLIALLEQTGDYRTAIERCQQRLTLDPLDERTYRWLMRLHALNQDRAGALRVYESCLAVLERELGVAPEHETQKLRDFILAEESGHSDRSIASSTSSHEYPGQPGSEVPFIGRRGEWARAMSAHRRVAGGEAHLLVIRGEAGIGKSRLAAEIADWAKQHGIASANSRAYAAEGRLAYSPVAAWLRSGAVVPVLPRLDRVALSEISRLVPELLLQRPDVPRPSPRVEDCSATPSTKPLPRRFLRPIPPLLVLDDFQWCDADTLEWLHFLLRADPGRRSSWSAPSGPRRSTTHIPSPGCSRGFGATAA